MFRDSGRESDVEGVSPVAGTAGFTLPDGTVPPPPSSSVMYNHTLPGLPIGSSTVLYGPPPDGARLVYGPPPNNLTVPLVPNGTLHCNVPGHQDLVSDMQCYAILYLYEIVLNESINISCFLRWVVLFGAGARSKKRRVQTER